MIIQYIWESYIGKFAAKVQNNPQITEFWKKKMLITNKLSA